jgi:hypothetical protein
MGRVKKYSKQHSNKKRNQSRESFKLKHPKNTEDEEDAPMTGQEAALSVAKRKQIFKKTNRRDVKKRIAELRLDSIKLKKRNLDQKAQKKIIAHEIKDLR